MNEEKQNVENSKFVMPDIKPRLFGIHTQDGLVELFWVEKKAEEKIQVYKKDHPYAVFWVEEVYVS